MSLRHGSFLQGYSTSETWYAILDYGTNYCNLHNLITGTCSCSLLYLYLSTKTAYKLSLVMKHFFSVPVKRTAVRVPVIAIADLRCVWDIRGKEIKRECMACVQQN